MLVPDGPRRKKEQKLRHLKKSDDELIVSADKHILSRMLTTTLVKIYLNYYFSCMYVLLDGRYRGPINCMF